LTDSPRRHRLTTNDRDLTKRLAFPNEILAGVVVDVGFAVDDLAAVRGPPEIRMQQPPKRDCVGSCQRICASVHGIEQVLLTDHTGQYHRHAR